MSPHSPRRLCIIGAAATLALLVPAAPASAHVTITPSSTAAGAHATLEVSVGHGCAGSPTTEITIQLPEEITSVTPTRNALWEVEKAMEAVEPPIEDGHGNEVVERVASVSYTTDSPLPEGFRDVFELSVTLPDSPGTILVFPIVQRCEEGESAWTQVPEEGQSAEDLEQPAPAFTLTAAEDSGHDAAATTAAATDAADEPDAADDAGGTSGLAVGALGAGLLGVMLGAAALLLHRRRT